MLPAVNLLRCTLPARYPLCGSFSSDSLTVSAGRAHRLLLLILGVTRGPAVAASLERQEVPAGAWIFLFGVHVAVRAVYNSETTGLPLAASDCNQMSGTVHAADICIHTARQRS